MITLLRHVAAPCLHNVCQQLPMLGLRCMSGSAVVDQMLGYVWKDLKGQGQPAIDVLHSGLSMQPDPSKGFDSARLNLALSEAFAAEHNWGEAAASSQAAAAAASAEGAAAADLAGLARLAAARALLVAGRDTDAAAAVSTAGASTVDAVRLAQHLMVQHATTALQPDAAAAGLQQLQQALDRSSSSSSSSGGARGVLLAVSHQVAGDLALAQGNLDAASSSYTAAMQALGGSSSDSKAVSFEADPASCLSSRLQQEVAADVALGAAQVFMARKEWEASEESLSAALAAAEAACGEAGPTLAPVLLLLGYGYARSARVVFAEGMLREAAKVLGATEPNRLVDKPANSSRQLAHPSLKAAVAWRYCQLLTALPNRGAEAATWGDAACALWQHAGSGFEAQCGSQGPAEGSGLSSLQEILGDDVALTGKGQHGHGRGVVVSLLLRRLLPVAAAPAKQ